MHRYVIIVPGNEGLNIHLINEFAFKVLFEIFYY